MKYPQSLINKVRRLYPNNKDMETHAQNGNMILGRYLDDGIPEGVSPKEILDSTDLKALKEKAQIVIEKRELYNEWFDLTKTK